MKVHTLLLAGAALIAGAAVLPAQEALVLNDFDGNAAPTFRLVGSPEMADADGDGDKECTAVGDGFSAVFKYMVPRSSAASLLGTTPILRGEARAKAADNTGRFVAVVPVVQTNAGGDDIYEPLEGLKFNPLSGGTFEFDLSDAVTKDGAKLADLLDSFAGGAGDFLSITLVQQSPKGVASKVTYDDIELAPAQ